MKIKIQKVITDSVLREKMVVEGHSVVKKYYWVKTAQETLKIYKKILK
jgi:hypothetical protein